MIRSAALSAIALFACGSASTALAADDKATPDLRCMAVALAMAGNPSDQVKNAGTMASLYYLGRIDAQAGVDLEAGLKRELTTMSPQDLKTEAVRCGQELQGRGKAVIDMAARLQALATAPKAP